MISERKNIYLIAIGGTGMAALAAMLKADGHQVSGSDLQVYPPMSDMLKQQQIEYADGYRAENLPDHPDWVIIGNAVSRTNPEVEKVLQRGIPYLSFPQALAKFFLAGRRPIVVVGTHGKTTTSALTSWILDQAGWAPGFLIGGLAKNFSGNSRKADGEYFVVEGDEYDTAFFDKGPKFLHYSPYAAILTNIEYDHADIFPSLEDIKRVFRKFIHTLPPDRLLMAIHGDPNVWEVLQGASCQIETFGLNEGADWRALDLKFQPEGMKFRILHRSDDLGEYVLPMVGRHNVVNALASIALAYRLGCPVSALQPALSSFQGVRRRQEIIGIADGVTVLDDFAHHPTAIRETLLGLRGRYIGRRLWAVYEPRSATSRRRVFQKELAQSFEGADRVVLGGIYAPDRIPEDQRLDPEQIVADLGYSGIKAFYAETTEKIIRLVVQESAHGDIICIMSSGGFGGLHGKMLQALESRSGP